LLPNQQEFSMFQTIARAAQTSGLYAGVGQEAKIFMVLLAARELGISPMLALNGGIWNIQGKIEISARLMNSLVRRAGHSIKIIRSDDKACVLLGKRTDGDTFECEFTIEEAAKAGLASRDVWKKYTSDMLYNRCMSRLARRLFSDVIGTAYVEGEIRDAIETDPNKIAATEYEDLTENKQGPAPTIPSKIEEEKAPDPEPKPTPQAKMTPMQISELNGNKLFVDDDVLENMLKWAENQYGTREFKDMPKEAFDIFLRGFGRNRKKVEVE